MFVCLHVRTLHSVGPPGKVIYSTLFMKQKRSQSHVNMFNKITTEKMHIAHVSSSLVVNYKKDIVIIMQVITIMNASTVGFSYVLNSRCPEVEVTDQVTRGG